MKMLSKAMFDLDHSNNPVINLDIKFEGDVRDKIAKRFIGDLGHTSAWCEILANGSDSFTIWPLKPSDLRFHAEKMLMLADQLDKAAEEYTKTVEK